MGKLLTILLLMPSMIFGQAIGSFDTNCWPAEKALGYIYNKSSFANTTDFILKGGITMSSNGSAINIGGGAGTFDRYATFLTPHSFSNYAISMDVKMINAADNSSYGLGIGLRSINASFPEDIFGWVNLSTVSTPGQLLLYNSSGRLVASSGSVIHWSTNDIIRQTFSLADTVLTYTVQNITTGGTAVSVSVTYLNSLSLPLTRPNASNFSIYEIGGTFQIQSLSVHVSDKTNSNIAVASDSKFAYYAGNWASAWPNLLSSSYPTVTKFSGSGDMASHGLLELSSLALLNPRYLIWEYGSNDLRHNVSLSTVQGYSDNIYNYFTARGTTVYFILIPEDSVAGGVGQKSFDLWYRSHYPSNYISGVWDSLSLNNVMKPGYLADGNVHVNAAGHAKIAQALAVSGKFKLGGDEEAPVISCPPALAVGTNTACTYVGSGVIATATDNCSGGPDLVITSDAPAAFPLGATTVTWKATDAAGNFSTCTQVVTVSDDDAPVISCAPALAVGTNNACTYVGSIGTVTATDNCSSGAALVITNNAPAVFPLGATTVTWKATDAAGNFSTCTQVVTVSDDDAPVISCAPAVAVGTNNVCAYVGSIGTVIATDNCSSGSALVMTNNAPAAFPLGNTTVTWKATDASGNFSTCTQVVTVSDDDAPAISCPAALAVGTNNGCTYVGLIGTAIATDNCSAGSALVITNNAPAAFPIGHTTVTWRATDAAGNFSTCTQVVTVSDNVAPVISCPATVAIGTNTACTYLGSIGTATATDNCSGGSALVITNNAPAAFPLGNTTVTWKATDAAGNFSTCTQVVTVSDDDAPAISCPAALAVGTNNGCTYVGSISTATATDNCSSGAALVITNNAPVAFALGATTVTWKATDAAGNFSICTQVVTVSDDDAPVITCPAALAVGTNNACTYMGSIGTATGTDNCSGGSALVITNNAPAAFPLGNTTVTWKATDAAGNFSTCTQVVTVSDDDAPVISCPTALAVGTNNACTYLGSIGTATATDNCSGGSALVITNNAPAAFPSGNTTVTWKATDAAGNFSTCTQVVTVVDDDAPVISCPPAVAAGTNNGCTYVGSIGTATATDNCSAGSALVITNNAPATFPLGVTTVTWKATGAAGNFSTCTQIVTARDDDAPVISCPPALIVSPNNACTYVGSIGTATATDNCSGGSALVITNNAPAAFTLGATTVTWKATDAAGNFSTCTQVVTVQGPCNSSCESPGGQAYISGTQTGNQSHRGELGMQFIVNNPGGIIVKQLGAFDDGNNGITGLQPGGGIRVAIFNRFTHNIIPGLEVIISGLADGSAYNHRMKNISPAITLPPGDYVIVAKGYHAGERNGNSFEGGGPYSPGGNGGGAITFGNQTSYGSDDPNGFSYPAMEGNFGNSPIFLAGTLNFTIPIPCAGPSTNANLSGLALSQGTLTPAFEPATLNYTSSLANNVTSVRVTSTAADAGATITVNGTPVASGTPSGSIALAEGSNIITVAVTAADGATMKSYTINATRAAGNCESPVSQAYTSNTQAGIQAHRGELGMQFIVNDPGGIVVKQLGAFDHGGNGISGLQPGGGVRVAIFNRSTHNIVPGLDITVIGNADHLTGNHRMKDVSPVTLPPGDYVIVAKGYHAGEKNGNSFESGTPYPSGNNGGGAITFGNQTSYGPDDPNGFSYPASEGNFGNSPIFLAGTFAFTKTVSCPVASATISVATIKALFKKEVGAKPNLLKPMDLQIYPNPANGQFNLHLSGVNASKLNIQVINSNGKLVEQRTIDLKTKNASLVIPFNLTDQPSGIYLVKVLNSDGIQTKKLVIRR